MPVHVAHGQLGLAAVCHLHKRVLLLIEQDLHPLHITVDAEENKELWGVTLSGFRLLTKRTEFPAPANPGMAMRLAAAAAADEMARGAKAPWTLGTERPAA